MLVADLRDQLAVLNPHLHEGVPLAEAARRAGVPRRTATRWLAAFQAGGVEELRRTGRSDQGGRRLPEQMVEFIEGLALRRPPPRIAEIHRAVNVIAPERGWPPVSYSVVRRIVIGLNRGLLALAHHGPDVYRDEFELVMRREAVHPNDIWQADHTWLDLMVLDQVGRPARPWLTVILDDHSRAVPGYSVFLGDPSMLQTALAFRQAIWRKTDPAWPVCGLPAVLYSDHGADFTSTHIWQVCADLRLRVQLIHSTPGQPRGRGKVERLFGTITTELLPTLPGHIPPGNRGRPVTPPALTLSELDTAVGRYIVDTYHHRTHPETGQAPNGAPGIGKTLSARTYAGADDWVHRELPVHHTDRTADQGPRKGPASGAAAPGQRYGPEQHRAALDRRRADLDQLDRGGDRPGRRGPAGRRAGPADQPAPDAGDRRSSSAVRRAAAAPQWRSPASVDLALGTFRSAPGRGTALIGPGRVRQPSAPLPRCRSPTAGTRGTCAGTWNG